MLDLMLDNFLDIEKDLYIKANSIFFTSKKAYILLTNYYMQKYNS